MSLTSHEEIGRVEYMSDEDATKKLLSLNLGFSDREIVDADFFRVPDAEPRKEDDRKQGCYSDRYHFRHPERRHQQHDIRAFSWLQ